MKDFLLNNLIVRWFRETLIRLMKKSPVYFQIIQVISGICIILPGLPEFLYMIHIPVNPALETILSKTMSIGGIIGLFISSLPVEKALPKTELVESWNFVFFIKAKVKSQKTWPPLGAILLPFYFCPKKCRY